MEPRPIAGWEKLLAEGINTRLVCNTVDTLIYRRKAAGHRLLPDFAVKRAREQGRLQQILREHSHHSGSFKVLWPSSKHLTPKLRVFIDTLSARLFWSRGDLRYEARRVQDNSEGSRRTRTARRAISRFAADSGKDVEHFTRAVNRAEQDGYHYRHRDHHGGQAFNHF